MFCLFYFFISWVHSVCCYVDWLLKFQWWIPDMFSRSLAHDRFVRVSALYLETLPSKSNFEDKVNEVGHLGTLDSRWTETQVIRLTKQDQWHNLGNINRSSCPSRSFFRTPFNLFRCWGVQGGTTVPLGISLPSSCHATNCSLLVRVICHFIWTTYG